MKRLAEQLTYSNVMVTVLAVIVLGGGTAYAASAMLPKGSVGMGQLKKGAVTPAKLSKAAKATLVGPTGPQGPRGETGPKGEAGEAATKLFAQIRSDGTVNTSSVPVTVDHYSTGTYFIDFGRDISHCVLLANEGSIPVFTTPGASTPAAQGYGVRAGLSSLGEEFPPGYPEGETAYIETFSGSSHENTSFFVAVLC